MQRVGRVAIVVCGVLCGVAGILWGGGGPLSALVGIPMAQAAPTIETPDTPPRAPLPFRDYDESFKDWRLYCQVWDKTRRVECELGSRTGTDRSSRVVWLRSSERGLGGLRFRLNESAMDFSQGVRIWVDHSLFKPDFSCKPFPFEASTCAVSDPAVNQKLVERLLTARELSAVGLSPTGAKSEVRFSLDGFKAAYERMEDLRRAAGSPWM